MKNAKVVKITNNQLMFDNKMMLASHHSQDCCEEHYLDFQDLNIQDFQDLEFDLSSDKFFKRIKEYGIELVPIKGHSIKIPGYGYNNGYYSDNINLVLKGEDGEIIKSYDVTECQIIKE